MTMLNQLIKEIVLLNPMQASFVEKSAAGLSAEDCDLFNVYLAYCLDQGVSMNLLAQSYDLIVKDTFKEQVYFQRHKKYRYSTYAEVASSVYESDEYMSKYMYGLALSAFLWPNHRTLHRFFLEHMPTNLTGHYLEVGPGHGFYFMQSMKRCKFSSYKGVDISPTSVAMTKKILHSRHFGTFMNYDIETADFLASKHKESYNFIVMAEVLEHVENPLSFLRKIKNLLDEKGLAFVTTCINAPAIDHIFLYQTIEQLESQIDEAGLTVAEKVVVPYLDLTLEETMQKQLPVNIALVLT